ncbi:hypothetical protein F5887DRAFT_887384, partial [Amanita rubescens]
YALGYKNIQFRTEWIEYPNIEGQLKELGIGPTSTKLDGRPFYTVPATYDPNTKWAIQSRSKILTSPLKPAGFTAFSGRARSGKTSLAGTIGAGAGWSQILASMRRWTEFPVMNSC